MATMLLTTDSGLESVLVEELRELVPGLRVRRVYSGRVIVDVPRGYEYRALLSRIVNHVYLLLEVFDGVETLDDVYRCVASIDFSGIIRLDESFAVRPERVGEHSFTSIDIGRVSGQAIVDQFLSAFGARPRVDLENPDIEVYVELNWDRLFVGLQLTRVSLHRRGYRVFNHPASLKSTIASAMLRLVGWRPVEGKGVLDPMCGGGTVVIEAALAAKGIYPVCMRREALNRVVCERVLGLDIDEVLAPLCQCGDAGHRGFVGIELNPLFLEGAVLNAHSAGVSDSTLFLLGDCRELIGLVKGLERELGAEIVYAVFNPPYGVRMRRRNLVELYRGVLTKLVDEGFEGVCFITSAIHVAELVLDELGLCECRKLYTMHGTLPSYIYVIEL